MKTSDAVVDRAFELAEDHRSEEEAADELVRVAMGRRVALVLARQRISDEAGEIRSELTQRAVALIDQALDSRALEE